MQAGNLSRWITFQKKTIVPDSFGGTVPVWVDDFSCYAAFEPLGSTEFPTVVKRYSESTARFRIRYRAGIDADLNRIQFVFDGDASPVLLSTWNIYPPIPVDGRRFEMTIEALEVR